MTYSELEDNNVIIIYTKGGSTFTELFKTPELAKRFGQALKDTCNITKYKIFKLEEV